MKNKADNTNEYDGYPPYPASEDIYNNGQIDKQIDPEDLTKMKQPIIVGKEDSRNELDFRDDKSGNDLDVPGAEDNDELEEAGSEDEENNYYSIGGDEHNELEEAKD